MAANAGNTRAVGGGAGVVVEVVVVGPVVVVAQPVEEQRECASWSSRLR